MKCSCKYDLEDNKDINPECEVHGLLFEDRKFNPNPVRNLECICYFEAGGDTIRHDFKKDCKIHGWGKK